MTLRALLVVLILLLAANLGVELWNRADPPGTSMAETAAAPVPCPCYLSYYDDAGTILLPPYRNRVGPVRSAALQEGVAADTAFVPAPDPSCPVVENGDAGERMTVARIIDGDTFVLSDSTRVRLIGIDTPEAHPSGKLSRDAERTGMDRETIRALGRRASAYAAELTFDKPVELEYGSRSRTDRYGRTLAYVWVLDEDGQRLYRVNDRLVADGYANVYSGIPFEYSEQYLEYERKAREARRGLWGE